MTEREWLACTDPKPMLEFLRGRASARKCRLLAAAFCRQFLPPVRDRYVHRAVEVAERYADGLTGPGDVLAVSKELAMADHDSLDPAPVSTDPPPSLKMEPVALQTARILTGASGDFLEATYQCARVETLRRVLFHPRRGEAVPPYDALFRWQVSAIRDVMGSPFHPSPPVPPAVLAWGDGTVPRLARAIYEERKMPEGTLDNGRLAILADALLDAGCEDEGLIDHCRSEGPHWRGCWALDCLLGKE